MKELTGTDTKATWITAVEDHARARVEKAQKFHLYRWYLKHFAEHEICEEHRNRPYLCEEMRQEWMAIHPDIKLCA